MSMTSPSITIFSAVLKVSACETAIPFTLVALTPSEGNASDMAGSPNNANFLLLAISPEVWYV